MTFQIENVCSSYERHCGRCQDRVVYIGETSKPAYTRIKQHYNNYRAAAAAKLAALPNLGQDNMKQRDVKSWMWEHTRDVHGGVLGDENGMSDYMMNVTGRFTRCLERQVTEGIRI